MGVLRLFLFVATINLLEAAAAVSNECKQLGFSDTLLCSSCVEFEKHINHQQLVADCKKCCVEEETAEEFYDSAKLTVCSWKLGGFPEIKHFITKEAPNFGKLQVQYVGGAYPTMELTAADGKTKKIPLNDWKSDTLKEYLTSKLAS